MPAKAQSFSLLSPVIITILCLALTSCSSSSLDPAASERDLQAEEAYLRQDGEHPGEQESRIGMLSLPSLAPVDLRAGPLSVVATTSIIGDVVGQVGGDAIALTTLMRPGQDPHSYEPSARELTTVAKAQVIFVNGWGLEEALVQDLAEIGGGVPLVPISANIQPLMFHTDDLTHDGDTEQDEVEPEHGDRSADPHVWFSIRHVKQWVKNVERILSDLDPANAEVYRRNAAGYLAELVALEAEVRSRLAQFPEGKRSLVTNHASLNYFAQEYGFTVLGTVIPTASTLAEPSASDLAGLIEAMEEQGVCTLFTETTVRGTLANTIAAELDSCDEVQVSQLFTGAIGPVGSGADSYIGMFRHNVAAIVAGLQ